jgi:hypothetical protein
MKMARYLTLITTIVILLFILSGLVSAFSLINNGSTKTISETSLKNGYSFELETFSDSYYFLPAEPGMITTFWIKIKNTGSLDDTYEITAGSIEDITILVNNTYTEPGSPFETMIPSETSQRFFVTAKIYEDVQEVPVGEWSISVKVTSKNDATVTDELELFVNIIPDFPVNVYTRKPSYRVNMMFPLFVENIGDKTIECYIRDVSWYNENGEYLGGLYIMGSGDPILDPGESSFLIPFIMNETGIFSITCTFLIDFEAMYVETFELEITKNKSRNVQFFFFEPLSNLFQLLQRILKL